MFYSQPFGLKSLSVSSVASVFSSAPPCLILPPCAPSSTETRTIAKVAAKVALVVVPPDGPDMPKAEKTAGQAIRL